MAAPFINTYYSTRLGPIHPRNERPLFGPDHCWASTASTIATKVRRYHFSRRLYARLCHVTTFELVKPGTDSASFLPFVKTVFRKFPAPGFYIYIYIHISCSRVTFTLLFHNRIIRIIRSRVLRTLRLLLFYSILVCYYLFLLFKIIRF